MTRFDSAGAGQSEGPLITPMRTDEATRVAELAVEAFGEGAPTTFIAAGTAIDWLHLDVLRERAGGDIVAFIQYWQAHEDTHVVVITTRAEHRGRGHASRLIEHVAAQARDASYYRVTLYADRSNPRVLGLYAKRGFCRATPRPGSEVPERAVFMARTLRF